MSTFRLVDESIFVEGTTPEPGTDVQLAGARCRDCGTTTFPYQDSCPRCSRADMGRVSLPQQGVLWAFTVQGFPPKPPYRADGPFEPYGVGYVDLGGVLVETRLTINDPAALANGDRLRVELVPVFTDEDGTRVLTYAFGPVTDKEVE